MAIIDKPSDYFNTKLYTGDNTNNRQISLDFSPDFTWIKARNTGSSHILFDRVRTNANYLLTNATNAEVDGSSVLSWTNSGCTTNSFTVDLGSNGGLNGTGTTFVAWNWLAGGTAVSNTDGSITSSVSANTTAGFSIVSFTGNGSAGATVGHGLGTVPQVYILKNRSSSVGWTSYFEPLGATKFLQLNTTAAAGTATEAFNNTSPTSSVFSIGLDTSTNQNTANFIAYCFAEKQGYSKFGSYVGNGSTDGTFVYTGFKPAFVIQKRTDSASNWEIYDNKRGSFNTNDETLYANLSNVEADAGNGLDFLAQGFKWRTNASYVNASGGSYIYMAFASNPFVTSTGVPATAR